MLYFIKEKKSDKFLILCLRKIITSYTKNHVENMLFTILLIRTFYLIYAIKDLILKKYLVILNFTEIYLNE